MHTKWAQIVAALAMLSGPISLGGCQLALGLGSDLPDRDGSDGDRSTDAGLEGRADATTTKGRDGGVDGKLADAGRDTSIGDETDAQGNSGDSPDSGIEGGSCTNACTAGLTECGSSGEVETCQSQANGCTAWITTSTCGPHQTCTSAGGTATCLCTASLCTEVESVCEDATTLATCALDADQCAYVASTSICASPESCSGVAPSAACSLTCTNSCTAGQTSCVSGGLATCILGSNGCYAYGGPVACPSSFQSCTGTAGNAACTCNSTSTLCTQAGSVCENSTTLATCGVDESGCSYLASTLTCTSPESCTGSAPSASCALTCTNACTVGVTECGPGVVQTCEIQSNGCSGWVTTTTCGPHEACTAKGGTAMCACTSNQCMQEGSVCENGTTLAKCAVDANNCPYVASTSTCSSPQSCTGVPPSASCALTCTSSCTPGQTSCVSGGLATCALGSNGCYAYGAPVPCASPHQTCTGTAGSAACTCNVTPPCTTTGKVCASANVLETCSTDSQGCVYGSANTTCTNACYSGACTYCIPGSEVKVPEGSMASSPEGGTSPPGPPSPPNPPVSTLYSCNSTGTAVGAEICTGQPQCPSMWCTCSDGGTSCPISSGDAGMSCVCPGC
jgi:hypothetical protein